MKGREDPIRNYIKSIPKCAEAVSHKPIMRDGQCVGSVITYEINGATVRKEFSRTKSPSPRR